MTTPSCPKCGAEILTDSAMLQYCCKSFEMVDYDEPFDKLMFVESDDCLRNQLAAANRRVEELESAIDDVLEMDYDTGGLRSAKLILNGVRK